MSQVRALMSQYRARIRPLLAGRALLVDVGKLQVAQIVAALCGVLQIVLITRALTPTDFGIWGLVISAATLARQVFSSRSNALLIRYHARFGALEQRRARRAVVGLALLLDLAATALGALLLVALATPLAAIVLHDPAHRPLVHLGALLLLCGLGNATATALLSVEQRFGAIATTDAVAAVVTLLLVAPITLLAPAVAYLLLAIAGATLLQTALRWMLAARGAVWADATGDRGWRALGALRPYAGELGRFVFGTNLLVTLKLIKGNVPGLFLGAALSPAHAGFYLLAQRIIDRMGAFIGPTQQVVFPRLSRALADGDRRAARRTYRGALGLNLLILLPFALVFAALGRWSVPFVFGAQYAAAVGVVQIVVLAFVVGSVLMVHVPLLTAAARLLVINAAYLAGIAVQLLLLLTLAPRYGSVGAAWALLSFHAVAVLITLPAVARTLRSPARADDRAIDLAGGATRQVP